VCLNLYAVKNIFWLNNLNLASYKLIDSPQWIDPDLTGDIASLWNHNVWKLVPTTAICLYYLKHIAGSWGSGCLRQPLYLLSILGAESSLYKKKSQSCSLVSDSLQPHGLSSPWNSPGQNTGVCSCSLLQGIFPNQGSNPGLQHFRLFLYQLSHQGRDLFLEFPHSNPTLTSSFRMRQIMDEFAYFQPFCVKYLHFLFCKYLVTFQGSIM